MWFRSRRLFLPPRYGRLKVFVFSAILALLAGSTISAAITLAATSAEQGKTVFDAKCVACHTIGGGKGVGPDLRGISSIRDHAWLVSFITSPDKVIAQGDPIAKQLLQEYGFPMPPLGVNEADANNVLAYIDSKSGTTTTSSPPPGTTQPSSTTSTTSTTSSASTTSTTTSTISSTSTTSSTPPVTSTASGPPPTTPPSTTMPPAASVERGRALFTGQVALQNHGPACIACHNVSTVGLLGGGRVGKDLTKLYSPAVPALLKAPPFPLMNEIYAARPLTQNEISSLDAFLKETSTAASTPSQSPSLFPVFGIAGAAVIIVILQLIWRGRLAGVRRSLVKGARK